MKDSELYTLSKDFVRAAIKVLKRSKKAPRVMKKLKISNLSRTHISFEETWERDYMDLIIREWDKIKRISTSKRSLL